MSRIKSKIFGGKKTFKEKDIIDIHDRMMVEYGWIPLEEFKKLPISTFFSLLNAIQKRKKAESDAMKRKR